jgi:hypothetical protein
MTNIDARQLLIQKIAESSQINVAKALGYSSGSILSQILSDTYKGSPDEVYRRVIEVYGGRTVGCPELGEITLAECSANKKREPIADSFYARLYRACQACERRN